MAIVLRKAVALGEKRVSLEDMGVTLRPQEFPPRNAFYLDQTVAPVIGPGIPGAPNTVIAFQYQVPEWRQGVLRRLSVDPSDVAALPSITFSVLRSNAPVHNYQNVPAPIGTIDEPDQVYVEFDRQQLLQVAVSNANVFFPYEVHVRVVAWFWDYVETSGR